MPAEDSPSLRRNDLFANSSEKLHIAEAYYIVLSRKMTTLNRKRKHVQEAREL
jgi:hypothetical protein